MSWRCWEELPTILGPGPVLAITTIGPGPVPAISTTTSYQLPATSRTQRAAEGICLCLSTIGDSERAQELQAQVRAAVTC